MNENYAVMPFLDYYYACEAVREKLGDKFRDVIKSGELYEKIYEVYEAAQESMLDAMWEALQGGGARTDCAGMFVKTRFNKSTFKPKYDFKPDTCSTMFNQAFVAKELVNMKELEEERGIVFDFSGCKGSFQKTFAGGLFSVLNVIDISNATNLALTFYGGYNNPRPIQRIERLICSETSPFVANTFGLQSNLKYIGFEGVVGKSIDLKDCPLTVESINKLFACLKDYSTIGGTYTVTLKADREIMLTDEEKAVATNKGWTLVWS